MEVRATIEISAAVETLRAINSKLALLEKQKKELTAKIKDFMGEAETLTNVTGDAIIGTLNMQGGKPKFDAAKFEVDYPELYHTYLTPQDPYQVFRTK